MSQVWIYSLVSIALVSLVSLSGILTILFNKRHLKKFLILMVSFAAGALLGDVFLHLLPELIEEGNFNEMSGLYIVVGILLFFALEKIIHWRHCHLSPVDDDHCHPLGIMNLIGGGVHNFLDGVLIAASYSLSIEVGVATTVAVILHEIPQEMGDFGILLHSGMKVKKALLYNFLIELTALLGVVLILGLNIEADTLTQFIIPIAIGGFIYIANADLLPELHKDLNLKSSLMQLITLLAGLGSMYLLLFLPAH